jgi:hypothetical protein
LEPDCGQTNLHLSCLLLLGAVHAGTGIRSWPARSCPSPQPDAFQSAAAAALCCCQQLEPDCGHPEAALSPQSEAFHCAAAALCCWHQIVASLLS